MTTRDEYISEYLERVVNVENELRVSLDKLVVTLSSGALAGSIGFMGEIVNLDEAHHIYLLKAAWIFFILSLACVVFGVQAGVIAHRKVQSQISDKTIYSETPGGVWSRISSVLHNAGSPLLLLGVSILAIFVSGNI